MQRLISSALLIVFIALVGIACVPEPAFAAADPNATVVYDCHSFIGLSNRIAGCLRQTIDGAAYTYFDRIYPMLQKTIVAFITLGVVIYGVMLSQGLVERVGRDTIILLFKIASVTVFTTSSPLLYENALGLMDAASTVVVSYAPPSGPADNSGTDFTQAKCMQNMIKMQDKANADDPDHAKPVVGPWLGIDCLLDTVIGIKMPKTPKDTYNDNMTWFNDTLVKQGGGDNTGMSRTLMFLFFSGAQTSTVGLLFAIIGAIVIWGLLMLIIKAFFTYIAGYIGVALMMILSPLFIPLILFRHTQEYFNKWVKVVFSFAMQPIIMLVFITFSLAAIDFAAFSGTYSIMYSIAGKATQEPKFDLNYYLTVPRDSSGGEDTNAPPAATSKAIINNSPRTLAQIKADNPTRAPSDVNDVGGLASGNLYSMCTADKIAADTTGTLKKVCAYQYPVSIITKSIDWDMMAKARAVKGPAVTLKGDAKNVGTQICREVLASAIFCAVVIFVMNGLMSIVPFMAYDLLGDFAQSPNIGAAEGGGTTAGKNLATSFSGKMQTLLGKSR